jgi:hypothetical protein
LKKTQKIHDDFVAHVCSSFPLFESEKECVLDSSKFCSIAFHSDEGAVRNY